MDWISNYQTLLTWLFVVSSASFLLGLVLMPLLIARMRADYFLRHKPTTDSWGGRHPAARLSIRILRNVVGVVLLLAGLAMLVLPGQGILSILFGISLLNFPGRRKLELRIVRHRRVLGAIGWIRSRAGSPPLILPPKLDSS